ncbi:MAG: TonB-dependent receptor, partial [Bacteroidales bacterium]|nr:TonB-dependent receptor [Bacteroidales bacterium]
SQRGYPGAAVREEPGTFKHQDRQWDSDFFLQTSWRKNVHERYDLLLNGKYAYNYLHYRSDPNMDATTMYIDNHYRQQELYGSCANRWSITDRWSAGLSIDVQRNTLTADMRDFVEPTRLTGLAAAATALHLPHFTMQADILATLVHDRMKTEATTHNRQKLTPSIAMSWQPVETLNFNIRSFYKSIFRMPTLNDLYYTFIGNSALAPEKTVQYNIGMTFTAPIGAGQSLEFQADVYRNDVTDKIIAMPASNQFRWTMVNLGKVEIRGLDLSTAVSRQIGHDDGIHCRLNYTYQKAQDFTNPESSYYGDYIPYIPLHSGSAVAGGNIGRWEFNYSFLYTGERWNASANIPENHEKQWYTSDVSASGTFQWGQRTVRLTAEVNNLFNQQYEVVQCYPMPGTNFYILLCINI